MAPLPCSPVSNSTASESQSGSVSEVSDASRTTPRPGPADPRKRTVVNPRSPLPVIGTPESPRQALLKQASPPTSSIRILPLGAQQMGHPRKPYTHASSPKTQSLAGALDPERPERPERRRSVTFASQTHSQSDHQNSVSGYQMTHRHSPSVSPSGKARHCASEEGESSADENTAIFRKAANREKAFASYGAVAEEGHRAEQMDGYNGAADEPEGDISPAVNRRKSGASNQSRSGSRPVNSVGQVRGSAAQNEQEEQSEPEGFFKKLVWKYRSVELENTGSVARDHLALERTFLAWLRTSLSFASIGVGVTQLFRLNIGASLDNNGSTQSAVTLADQTKLRQVGKPLGATFLAIAILILLLGFHRYFESQHYVIRGKFPASRGSIIIVSFVAGALIGACLVVVVVVSPAVFERR